MAGQLTIDTLKASSGVLATQNGMTGVAKAWAQWTYLSSTLTLNGSFNVSSVTRVATGVYTITFSTSMPNINYSAVATSSVATNGNTGLINTFTNNTAPYYIAPTVSSFSVNCNRITGAVDDLTYVSIAVFSA